MIIGHTSYAPAVTAPKAVIERRGRETGNYGPWHPAPEALRPPGAGRGITGGAMRAYKFSRGTGRFSCETRSRLGQVWKLSRSRPNCDLCGRQVAYDFQLVRSDADRANGVAWKLLRRLCRACNALTFGSVCSYRSSSMERLLEWLCGRIEHRCWRPWIYWHHGRCRLRWAGWQCACGKQGGYGPGSFWST